MGAADSTVNLQIATAYNGAGATAAEQGITRLTAAAGQAQASAAALAGTPAAPEVAPEAETKLLALQDAADGLIETLQLGAGLDIGARIVETVAGLPGLFTSAIETGVRFNATVESATIGVAGILKQFNPEEYATFDAALTRSADVIELLKEKAKVSPATFTQLVEGYQSLAGAYAEANIPLEQQVDLTVLMSQALAGLGIRSEQLVQESRSLVTGIIDENSAAAKRLEITAAQIAQAKEQGRLYDFLTGRLGAFAEAGAAGANSLQTLASNFEDAQEQLAGAVSEPVFESLKEVLRSLNEELGKPETVDALRAVGVEIGGLVGDLGGLARYAIENADTLALLTRGTVAWGVALGALKLKDIVLGLGAKVVAMRAASAATVDLTTLTVAGTAATAADTGARTANAAATGAQAAANARQATTLAGVSSALTVGLAAGIALNQVIAAAAADIDAAARKAAEIGAEYTKASRALTEQVRSAKTAAEQDVARLAVQKEIVAQTLRLGETSGEERAFAERRLALARALLANFDEQAGVTRESTDAAKEAAAVDQQRVRTAARLAELTQAQAADEATLARARAVPAASTERERRELAERVAAGRTEIAALRETLALLDSGALTRKLIAETAADTRKLTAEEGEKLREVNTELLQRRQLSESLVKQEEFAAGWRDKQLEQTRAIATAQGIDSRYLSDANGFLAASAGLSERERLTLFKQVALLAQAEELHRKITGEVRNQRQTELDAINKRLGDERGRVDEVKKQITATDPNTREGVLKRLELERELLTLSKAVQATGEAALAKMAEAVPGLTARIAALKAELASIPPDGSEENLTRGRQARQRINDAQQEALPSPLSPVLGNVLGEIITGMQRALREQPVVPAAGPTPGVDTSRDTGPLSDANYEETAAGRVTAAGTRIAEGGQALNDAATTVAEGAAKVTEGATAVQTAATIFGEQAAVFASATASLPERFAPLGEAVGSLNGGVETLIGDLIGQVSAQRNVIANLQRRVDLLANA